MTTTTANAAEIAQSARSRARAGLDRRTVAIIVIAPVVITLLCVALCVPPAGRRFYDWVTSENKPVEMITFVLALTAAVMAVRFASHLLRRRQRLASGFYVLFALGMFFIGMEEISWGQQLFGWETPADWGQMNAQKETTLHNLGPLQGKNDILRLAFGLGGLIGIALSRILPRFRVLFPHPVLLTWFLVIAGVSAVQVYVDLAPKGPLADPLGELGRLAEVVELLISIAAVLYLWLNRRALVPDPTP